MTPQLTKIWEPHKKQALFTSLPDSIFEGLYGGAAGGGKSDELVMLPMVRKFHESPYFKGIIFRRTYPELESEIIMRSREWYPHFGGTYNEEKRRWTFASGAVMRFGHCEYEQDIRKYDSDEYSYGAFDELTSFTEFQYRYFIGTRMRNKSSSNLPVIVRSGTNPGNIGHAWVRARFIEPAPWGTIMADKLTGLKRIFIQCLLKDNPHIDPNYVNRLMSLPEAERRAKLDGDWYTFEGQVFTDWRETHFPGEPLHAIHVIKPFNIPDWWTRILSVDWGYNAFTIGLWGALSPNDRLYFYREYAQKNKKVIEWASEIGNLSQGEQFARAVLCRSAWQNRGEDDLVIAEKATKYSGIEFAEAKNDRIQGKLALQEFMRWTPKPPSKNIYGNYSADLANEILRKHGIDAYKDYLKSYEPEEPETNLPKLQVFEQCQEFRKVIPLCIYDKKNSTTNKPSEDVKEFEGDDPYDAGRYLVMEADQLLGELKLEGDRRKKIGSVIENFEKTKDYTTLHRQMERLEAEAEFEDVKPIKRFHRTRVA